jgi:hypothetical protein
MGSLAWIRIAAVAVMWLVAGGAAYSGWMLGKSDSADTIAALRHRLEAAGDTGRTCRSSIHLLRREAPPKPSSLQTAARTQGRVLPDTFSYLHLREMLTTQ